ncbi:MAG: NHL repeat-containing protein [Phycisphaeraceae bacterium]|nr:NHL repeat-containing protein [Phycisphaeraceae bacterium]
MKSLKSLFVVALLAFAAASAHAERFVLVGSWQGAINRYRLDGSFVDQFVAPGTGGMSFPDGMAYGADGNLYVADANNARVLRFNGSTGAIMGTFAMGSLQRAGYCEFGPDGLLYVCSNGDNAVHRFDPTTGASPGVFAKVAGMQFPAGLAWSDNTMYVTGFQSNRVYKFNAVSGASLGTLAGTFNMPLYVRAGLGGNLYISEYGRNAVSKYSLVQNQIISSYTNQMNGPVGQTVLPDGTMLVTEWNAGIINKYNEATGAFLGAFVTGFPQCNDILVTPDIVPAPGALGGILLGLAVLGRRRR